MKEFKPYQIKYDPRIVALRLCKNETIQAHRAIRIHETLKRGPMSYKLNKGVLHISESISYAKE